MNRFVCLDPAQEGAGIQLRHPLISTTWKINLHFAVYIQTEKHHDFLVLSRCGISRGMSLMFPCN